MSAQHLTGWRLSAGDEVEALRKALRDLDCPDILGTAEACASGLPKWEHVSRKINAARALLQEQGQ
mgnify:CR=1 FL=1